MPRTTFADVICDYALVQIDDTRLQQQMAENPARFFRKMSLYMLNAIPRFNRPPEAREWLKYAAPAYTDLTYIPPQAMKAGDTITTEAFGYEMCCGVIAKADGYGGIRYVPFAQEYDSATGIITLSQPIEAGARLELDFYTDGVFDRQLGGEMKRILGLCVQLVWENRFVNAFLIQQPKIKDKSFDVGNEANYMRSGTERLRALTRELNGELLAFEQSCYYQAAGTEPLAGATLADDGDASGDITEKELAYAVARAEAAAKAAEEAAEQAQEVVAGQIPPATADRIGGIKVGENLEITEDGVLSVATADDMEQDNTLPITSAAVYTEVGNINSSLQTI